MKPKFAIGSPEVRKLKDKPAFPPHVRLEKIKQMTQYLRGTQFAYESIAVGDPVKVDMSIFPLPTLEFAIPQADSEMKNEQLETDKHLLHLQITDDKDESIARREWGEHKLEYLAKHGPLVSKKIHKPYIVFPVSLKRNQEFQKFRMLTQNLCQEYGNIEVKFILEPYQDNAHPGLILEKLKGLHQKGADLILLALPEDPTAMASVYAGAKSFHEQQIKCFSTSKMLEVFRTQGSRNYTLMNTLGLLVEAGFRFWGLADKLTFEMHIGIDVAFMRGGSLMGCSASMKRDGTDIIFDSELIPLKKSRIRREGIPGKILREYIERQLESFHRKYGRLPENILFQRDGRLFEGEMSAIRRAMKNCIDRHSGCSAPAWTAVAIQKSTAASVRFFRQVENLTLRPWSGTYFIETKRVGHLVTAGEPSASQGSPRPLQVQIVDWSDRAEQHISIEIILHDLFKLSQLNWGSPHKDIRLPVTLRFTDSKLERYAAEIDDEELEDDDWGEDED